MLAPALAVLGFVRLSIVFFVILAVWGGSFVLFALSFLLALYRYGTETPEQIAARTAVEAEVEMEMTILMSNAQTNRQNFAL